MRQGNIFGEGRAQANRAGRRGITSGFEYPKGANIPEQYVHVEDKTRKSKDCESYPVVLIRLLEGNVIGTYARRVEQLGMESVQTSQDQDRYSQIRQKFGGRDSNFRCMVLRGIKMFAETMRIMASESLVFEEENPVFKDIKIAQALFGITHDDPDFEQLPIGKHDLNSGTGRRREFMNFVDHWFQTKNIANACQVNFLYTAVDCIVDYWAYGQKFLKGLHIDFEQGVLKKVLVANSARIHIIANLYNITGKDSNWTKIVRNQKSNWIPTFNSSTWIGNSKLATSVLDKLVVEGLGAHQNVGENLLQAQIALEYCLETLGTKFFLQYRSDEMNDVTKSIYFLARIDGTPHKIVNELLENLAQGNIDGEKPSLYYYISIAPLITNSQLEFQSDPWTILKYVNPMYFLFAECHVSLRSVTQVQRSLDYHQSQIKDGLWWYFSKLALKGTYAVLPEKLETLQHIAHLSRVQGVEEEERFIEVTSSKLKDDLWRKVKRHLDLLPEGDDIPEEEYDSKGYIFKKLNNYAFYKEFPKQAWLRNYNALVMLQLFTGVQNLQVNEKVLAHARHGTFFSHAEVESLLSVAQLSQSTWLDVKNEIQKLPKSPQAATGFPRGFARQMPGNIQLHKQPESKQISQTHPSGNTSMKKFQVQETKQSVKEALQE